MDSTSLIIISSIGIPILSGVVWLVRLEGKTKLLEALHLNLAKDVQEIGSDVKQLLREVRSNGHASR